MSTPTLEEARAALVAALGGGGFRVVEHLDGRVVAPAVVIACGSPYLTDGDVLTPDELVCNLDLFLLFRIAQRDAMTVAVNRGVQDVLLVLDHERWTFRGASAPFRATNLQGNPPVCRLQLSTSVRITEGTD